MVTKDIKKMLVYFESLKMYNEFKQKMVKKMKSSILMIQKETFLFIRLHTSMAVNRIKKLYVWKYALFIYQKTRILG